MSQVGLLTNEEKGVKVYSNADRPTNPSEVTHDTPLERLNFNWSEKELPERERTKHVHRLHPYLGKFIPQLVEILLRKYFEPGQTVLDPFCGSGTTLVQANELGINSIGYDVSAFNVLLCHAKVKKYNLEKTRKEVLDILSKLQSIVEANSPQPSLWKTESSLSMLPEVDDEYLRKWFAPQALRELITYRSLIESECYECSDLLKVILSRSARSARLTTHYDLDFPKHPQTEPYWCYKHSRICHPTTEAFKFLRRYSLDTLRRIEAFSLRRTNAIVKIRHADSRRAIFPSIDGIITSPPYVGLIDYHEQHAYAYHLLGLQDKRASEIGPAVNGSNRRTQEQYQKDVARVFKRAANSMPQGAWAIVVAHDRANLYDEIARMSGMEAKAVLDRHVNRRTGRRSSEFYESIFIWQKSYD